MKKNKIIIMLLLATFLIVLNIDGVSARTCVACGSNNLPIPKEVPIFVSKLVLFAKVMVPILIIVLGMVRFLTAMASGDEKVIKEKTSAFIRSLIAGVAVFLVVAIVQTAFGLLQQANPDNKSYVSCVNCFINGNCKEEKCVERPNQK